jgi:hypothetical protein
MDEAEAVLSKIRAGNGVSVEEISRLGPAQLPALRELAQSPEREPRRSALTVLTVMKAAACDDVYLRAVRDAEDDLPFIALEGLEAVLQPHHQPELLATFDARKDEGRYRAEIARTIGTLEGRADFWELRKRADVEQDEDVREGLRMALARMGDGPSREEIARRIPAGDWRKKRDFLERDLDYLRAPWILKPMLPLLDDEEILYDAREMWHGPHDAEIPSHFLQSERVCDRVVVRIAEISGRKFSFPPVRMVHFTPAQLDEVRAYVRGLP